MQPSTEGRRIDFNSPLPFYHQLAEILREEIDGGTWKPDELLPAEGALTEMYGVSRSVTRKTFDILEGEGRVLRIKGKGTVVIRPKLSYRAVESAAEWFTPRSESLHLGEVITAERVPVGGHIGRVLDMSPREDVWEVTLTHSSVDGAVSLSQLYLRIYGTLSMNAAPEFEPGGPDILQQLAAKYGLALTDSQMEIDMTEATDFEAEVLSVEPGSPLVQISSIESGKRLVGFVRTVVRPDHFSFSASVHRHPEAIKGQAVPTAEPEAVH